MAFQGGFECEFVEHKKPQEEFQSDCPICLLVLREPYQVTCCGKSYCQVCIERIKREKKACPTCNEKEFTDYPNKGLKQSLYSFKVYCTHKQQGCEWTGELGGHDKHLNSNPQGRTNRLEGCRYIQVDCMYCLQPFQRHNLTDHQNDDCPERPFSCQHCQNYESNFIDVFNNHWPVCKLYPVECPNKCGAFPPRQDLQAHITDECPLTVIDCDFHHVGCDVKLPRKDMPTHLKENLVTHMSLQAASYGKLLSELQASHTKLQASHTQLQASHDKLAKENQKLQETMAELDNKEQNLLGEVGLLCERNQNLQNTQVENKRLIEGISQELAALKNKDESIWSSNTLWYKVLPVLVLLICVSFKANVIVAVVALAVSCTAFVLYYQSRGKLKTLEATSAQHNGRLGELDTMYGQQYRGLQDLKTESQRHNRKLNKLEASCTEQHSALKDLDTKSTEQQNLHEDKLQKLHNQMFDNLPWMVLTLENFNFHRANSTQWVSPPITTCGRQMHLQVYPNGNGTGYGTHVSVYIALAAGPHDNFLKWPFRGDVIVKLLSQDGHGQHYSLTIPFDDSAPDTSAGRVIVPGVANQGWGNPKYISHDQLQYLYLKNDRLCFRVQVNENFQA